MVDYVVISVCCVACCYVSYLVLYFLKVVKVCGGDDRGPCCAGILYDGSDDLFLCMD